MPKTLPQSIKPYYVYMMKGKENKAAAATSSNAKKKRKNAAASAQDDDNNNNGDDDEDRIFIHVGKSRAPIRKVQRHNRLSVRIVTNRKLMTRVGGNWCLEEWFGPFSNRTRARAFQRLWTTNIRRDIAPPKPASRNTKHYSSRVPISSARLASQCEKNDTESEPI